ncbi:MAG: hypothetical protein Q4C44_00140 [bacterium]|nr:hypothetical protein [bacterium]
MNYGMLSKIKKDPKEYQYLINHSYWYTYLTRNPEYYKEFTKAFKENKRSEKINKTNSFLDTLDTVNTIFKIIK